MIDSHYTFVNNCLIYSVAPSITAELMNQTHIESYTASFTCQANSEPLPTISWYFDGTLLNESDTSKYTITNTNSENFAHEILNILNVQSSDAGIYTCNATNVVSSDTSSGVLTVKGKLQLDNVL